LTSDRLADILPGMDTLVDWPALLRGLKAAGVTQPEIALRLNCGQATVSDIARGKTLDPRFTLAAGLLRLAREYGVEVKTMNPVPVAA
jgi:transcriptional regulator with XRE-family HTH domain